MGLSVKAAAWAVGLVNGTGIISSPLIGWVADRTGKKKAIGTMMIGVGVAGALLIFAAGSWVPLALGSVFVGMAFCSYLPIFPSITREVVGAESFGRVWGFISMGGSAGAASGSWMGGYLYDLCYNYHLLWIIVSLFFLTASLCLAKVRRNS